MTQLFQYIIISLNIIFIILVLSALIYFKFNELRINRLSKFENYITILQYHMEKAYDIIYKDRILIYSLEATSLNDDEFKTVAKDFCVLALSMMGPHIVKELQTIYGDTLYFNITEYFNSRFDEDEIRKTAQNNYINNDVDEQGT